MASSARTTRNRRTALAAGVVGLALVAGACGGPAWTPSDETVSGAAAAAATSTLDADTTATLSRILEEGFETSGMPGVAAYVKIGDGEWSESLGVGDLDTEEPFDPAAHVRIASITKTFTATAVLELVDRGEISLDDTLDTFVPGITNGSAITVRDLLAMTSGVWDFTSDDELIARWTDDPTMPWTLDDTIELIQGKPAQFAPGEKVLYTDSNYALLTKILEEVTGMTGSEAVTSMVIEPLGLADTRFPAADQTGVPDPHQQGYRPPGQELGALDTLVPISEINPEVASGAGNMTSTVADLAVWARALANGDLLSPELQQQRLEFERFDGQKIDVGYGLGVIRINDVIGHDGAIIGYSTVAMYYPEADATFVIVGNASSNFTTPTMDIFLQMLATLYPDQVQ
jgi:D-alanyl-D-alanine carboxypeptidase